MPQSPPARISSGSRLGSGRIPPLVLLLLSISLVASSDGLRMRVSSVVVFMFMSWCQGQEEVADETCFRHLGENTSAPSPPRKRGGPFPAETRQTHVVVRL